MTKTLFFALAAACAVGVFPAWGAAPTTPPAVAAATSYAASGTVTSISLAKRTISISGTEYRFSDALRVFSASGKSLTPQNLQSGQSVSYSVDAALSPSRPYIKEIRVLGGPGQER